jgi:EmrB/QacA subfamily drug resistance transporter
MSTATATAGATRAERSQNAPIMTHRQILLVIYGLMAGMFLSSLDQTIVGTAIRTIGDDLHGLDQQAWVTTAYLITSTISVPIYGKLSDIFGRRPLFIFGISVFILGSILATFSSSMLMLAAFRGVQGIGAGALMSLPLAIMADILAPRERAKYQGYFFAVFGISSLIGPLVGGLFAGANEILWISGWRWVFLINLPIGLIALGMVLAFLHLPKVGKHKNPRIDWWGASAVIVALVPLLLVAEQGREWGWASFGAIACYVIGGLGVIAFVLIEIAMKDDAIIPIRLFHSRPFSWATGIGVLVGFGMFGAMMTIPLYMQIVGGLTPTESGFAMLPMVVGLMGSSMAAGQITARTGKYGIFPRTGTLIMALGFLMLTFVSSDTPVWFMMIGMFVVGLGLGQLMQSLVMASQNAVEARDMGVATSAATFFRQIGGTLGTAIMLSILFTLLPTNIVHSMADKPTLTAGLNAALDPAIGGAKRNAGVMEHQWASIVDPLKKNVEDGLAQGTAAAKAAADKVVTEKVTEGVNAAVAAGQLPAEAAPAVIAQKVAEATPAAEAEALKQAAKKANATVEDGALTIDWSDAAQRAKVVDSAVPKIQETIRGKIANASSGSNSATNDTSWLNGADAVLTKPFMVGFTQAIDVIYWVGFGVLMLAFVLTWFFKAPPLRTRSALQEQADAAGVSETGTIRVQSA